GGKRLIQVVLVELYLPLHLHEGVQLLRARALEPCRLLPHLFLYLRAQCLVRHVVEERGVHAHHDDVHERRIEEPLEDEASVHAQNTMRLAVSTAPPPPEREASTMRV